MHVVLKVYEDVYHTHIMIKIDLNLSRISILEDTQNGKKSKLFT